MAQQLLSAARTEAALADELGGGAVHPGDAAIGSHAHQRLQRRVQQCRCHLKAQHQMLVRLRLQQGVFDGRGIHADHGTGIEAEMLLLHHQVEHPGQAAMHVAYGGCCAAEGVQFVEIVLAVGDGAGLAGGGDDARCVRAHGLLGHVQADPLVTGPHGCRGDMEHDALVVRQHHPRAGARQGLLQGRQLVLQCLQQAAAALLRGMQPAGADGSQSQPPAIAVLALAAQPGLDDRLADQARGAYAGLEELAASLQGPLRTGAREALL